MRKTGIFITAGIVICIICSSLFIPRAMSDAAKKRHYDGFNSVATDKRSANICIVSVYKSTNENGEEDTSYSEGASGVIFARKGPVYYAITASHVVDKKDGATRYLARTTDIKDYRVLSQEEQTNNSDKEEQQHDGTSGSSQAANISMTLNDYYKNFPELKVEYTDTKSGLAIVSFNAENRKYETAPIAKSNPPRDEKLMLVSNPDGEHFVQTYGKILSSSVREFSTKKSPYSYNVLMHSAFESYGSSGGAAYNQKGELIGINIGGSVDLFGNFRKGALVPSEAINATIERWKKYFDIETTL